ncbi:MAG: prepilin-type N-terminal cleavage/methylation domain-containing protein [Planctomycetes bacterium]|nr:prepilin-type N-terminal cleavage/methylation domain-containing protein [Planctomycetota bacterium]
MRSSHRTSGCRTSGFTLIELLIAIAITSSVMLTVGTTFRVMLDSRQVIDELSESTEAGPRILNLIERDLRALWTYNVKKNAVLRGRSLDIGSFEADRIDVITGTDAIGYVLDNDNVQRKPTVCEVGYWLKQHPRYDLMELWRREDPMVDQELITQGSFQLVYDRLKSFKITYYKTLGHEAEELNEWDSSLDDELPRRIKIEFTLERKRGSKNVVSDAEVEDFEGAEKTYVRHIVLDRRMQEALQAGIAMVPVAPPEPEEAEAGGGGGGAAEQGMAGGAGGRAKPDGGGAVQTSGSITVQGGGRPGRGAGQKPPGGGPAQPPPRPQGGTPNLGDLLRGGGSGGLNGLFGGGGRR